MRYARALLDADSTSLPSDQLDYNGGQHDTAASGGPEEISVLQSRGAYNTKDAADSRPGLPEKRVSNHKLKGELGVILRYPTYREGLRAVHAGDQRPFD